MPVIRIACPDNGPESANVAAAVMGATLGMAAGPIKQGPRTQVRMEKTRRRNPNELTLNQHVFPRRSMEEFADRSGRVSVFENLKNKLRLAGTKNVLFCAQRAWDQQTENYMKHIEDRFQKTVHPILRSHVNTIAPEQKRTIDYMFALWYMRTRFRYLDTQEVPLVGISGNDLTSAQEENLEKNGYLFARMGGKMLARQLNGVQLQQRISHYARDLGALTGWGVIHAQSGEFIVPDVPSHTVIPLSPKLALVASHPHGTITEANLAEINSLLKAGSREYYFSRDISKCPFSG